MTDKTANTQTSSPERAMQRREAGGKMSLLFDLCCNNPNNGDFIGKVCAVQLPECSLELTCTEMYGGIKLAIESDHIKFGRLTIPHKGHITWYGNWCWDAVRISEENAVKILNYIRETGKWTCEAGWCSISDPYEAGTLTAEIIRNEFATAVNL